MRKVSEITDMLLMLEHIALSNHIIGVSRWVHGNRKGGLYPTLHPDEVNLIRIIKYQMVPNREKILKRLAGKKGHSDLPFLLKTGESINWKNEKID